VIRRIGSFFALAAVLAATTVLLVSDRAPNWYQRARERVFEVAADWRDRVGVVELTRDQIPLGPHTVAHITLFFGVTLVAGWVLRNRVRPLVVALVVFISSVGFELAQPLLSATRSQQVDDIIANGVGVAAGLVVLVLLRRLLPRRGRARSLAW
jgi:hypothetical protein